MKKSDERMQEIANKVLMIDYANSMANMASVNIMAIVQNWITKGFTAKEISELLSKYLDEFEDDYKLLYLDFYSEHAR